MGDPEVKHKRSQQRKRNIFAKILREQAFHQRIVDPTKQYKRVKLDPRNYESEDDEFETIREGGE